MTQDLNDFAAPRMRAQKFNRVPRENYAKWLCNITSVKMSSALKRLKSRVQIDNYIEGQINSPSWEAATDEVAQSLEDDLVVDQPSWVDAAEEVLQDVENTEDVAALNTETLMEVEEAAPVPMDEEEVVVEPSDSPFAVDTDYDSMTVAELRDVCRDRELTIRGTKAEVVLRLRRDDEGITEDTQPEEGETEAPLEEAAEVTLDAPSNEAVTEEVTTNGESSEQTEDINE
jgi:hypothetical protein